MYREYIDLTMHATDTDTQALLAIDRIDEQKIIGYYVIACICTFGYILVGQYFPLDSIYIYIVICMYVNAYLWLDLCFDICLDICLDV